MAGLLGARGFGAAALVLAGLTALPALAETLPLPRPNPHRTLVTGSVRDPIPPAALRARAQAPAPQQAQAAPNPVSNPFAALLGKPGSTQALNPQRFLLADKVDLMRDTNLVAVYADDVFITVVVEEKNTLVGTSRLMIMFDAKDMQLKQWTVTDPQGYDTTVAVYNLDASKKLDPNMFRIDYTRYHN
jgi:hypothetical protein